MFGSWFQLRVRDPPGEEWLNFSAVWLVETLVDRGGGALAGLTGGKLFPVTRAKLRNSVQKVEKLVDFF